MHDRRRRPPILLGVVAAMPTGSCLLLLQLNLVPALRQPLAAIVMLVRGGRELNGARRVAVLCSKCRRKRTARTLAEMRFSATTPSSDCGAVPGFVSGSRTRGASIAACISIPKSSTFRISCVVVCGMPKEPGVPSSARNLSPLSAASSHKKMGDITLISELDAGSPGFAAVGLPVSIH